MWSVKRLNLKSQNKLPWFYTKWSELLPKNVCVCAAHKAAHWCNVKRYNFFILLFISLLQYHAISWCRFKSVWPTSKIYYIYIISASYFWGKIPYFFSSLPFPAGIFLLAMSPLLSDELALLPVLHVLPVPLHRNLFFTSGPLWAGSDLSSASLVEEKIEEEKKKTCRCHRLRIFWLWHHGFGQLSEFSLNCGKSKSLI